MYTFSFCWYKKNTFIKKAHHNKSNAMWNTANNEGKTEVFIWQISHSFWNTKSNWKDRECRNLQRQDKIIPDRTDSADRSDSTDSTDLKSIKLWLTSTTDASEEVLIMRPTTYFFIPAEHMKALEVHSHLLDNESLFTRSRPLLPTQGPTSLHYMQGSQWWKCRLEGMWWHQSHCCSSTHSNSWAR